MVTASVKDFFVQLEQKPAPLLGIDHGKTSMGIAISDHRWIIASPLCTLDRFDARTKEKIKHINEIAELRQLVETNLVAGIVVGLPLSMNGKHNKRSQSVSDWAGQLEKKLTMPILLWDERLSSTAVDRAIQQMQNGKKKIARQKIARLRKKNTQTAKYNTDEKNKHDTMAAVYILQTALEPLVRLRDINP